MPEVESALKLKLFGSTGADSVSSPESVRTTRKLTCCQRPPLVICSCRRELAALPTLSTAVSLVTSMLQAVAWPQRSADAESDTFWLVSPELVVT